MQAVVVVAMVLLAVGVSGAAPPPDDWRPVYGGTKRITVRPGGSYDLRGVIPVGAPVAGYMTATYIWRLLRPTRVPSGVHLCLHLHMQADPCSERMTMTAYGFAETAVHSAWTIYNRPKVPLMIQVRFVVWDNL